MNDDGARQTADTSRICVGAIAGSYGVRGDVRLKSFCSVGEDIATYGRLTSEDGTRSFDISLGQQIKGGFSARLSGVTSKEAADALKGTKLMVARDQLPQLQDNDEFYYADLIGMDVIDGGGVPIGVVQDVKNYGASDVLEISSQDWPDVVIVPFTKEVVPTVDMRLRRIIIDPPEGILP